MQLTSKQLNVQIYKCHKLAGNMISITYAHVAEYYPNGKAATIGTQVTRIMPDAGGPLKSIAKERGL